MRYIVGNTGYRVGHAAGAILVRYWCAHSFDDGAQATVEAAQAPALLDAGWTPA
jgi:hypothetical protein